MSIWKLPKICHFCLIFLCLPLLILENTFNTSIISLRFPLKDPAASLRPLSAYMAYLVLKFPVSTWKQGDFAIYVGLGHTWLSWSWNSRSWLRIVFFLPFMLVLVPIGISYLGFCWVLVSASVPVSAVIVLVFSSKSYHQSEAVNCSMFLMWLDHSPDKLLVSLVSPDFDSSI